MKKNYTFYAILLMFPAIALVASSFSSGVTGNAVSGSPGDGGSTCTLCHAPGANYNATAMLSTTIPGGGYTPGTTYTITLTASSTTSRHGFQMTAERDSDNGKAGTWVITDATNTQSANSGTHVTHTFTGNSQTTWNANWTAPATDEGTISFYAVVNAASNMGDGSANDQIVTTSLSANVLGLGDVDIAQFQMYPNPTVDQLRVDLPQGVASAEAVVYNYVGAELLRQQITFANNSISVAQLRAGAYLLSLNAEGAQHTKAFVKR